MNIDNTSSRQSSPTAQMQQFLAGYQCTQLVHVAAKLRIADLLKDGPKTSDELARATGANPHILYRVLRTLAGMGVFAESEGKGFELTPLSELLQEDSPRTMYYAAMLVSDPFWQPWGKLYDSVMTGENASVIAHGVNHFEYLDQHPEVHELFDKGQVMHSTVGITAILDAYDFSGINRLVDVGGGRGHLISAILKKYPNMQGVLFDLKSVVEGAVDAFDKELTSRCEFSGGSALNSVPPGDACVVKSVVQITNDQNAATILRNCRTAVGPKGKVIVIDRILRNASDSFMDAHLMIAGLGGGIVRTEYEFKSLLNNAGLNLTSIIPTDSQFSVIEAVPA